METSATDVALEPEDTIPQIVSFLLHGSPAEFVSLYYQGVKVYQNGSLLSTVELYNDTLGYDLAEVDGIAASLWDVPSNESEQHSEEVVVALWPFRFGNSGNITITLDLRVRLPTYYTSYRVHRLSEANAITFYFPEKVEGDTGKSFIRSAAGESVVALACLFVCGVLIITAVVVIVKKRKQTLEKSTGPNESKTGNEQLPLLKKE